MKRSRYINLDKMRKRKPSQFLFRPLTLAIASITLAACSQPEEEKKILSSIEDCKANTSLTLEQCNVAYTKAIEEAAYKGPRYNTQNQCEEDFGQNQCLAPASTGIFVPMLAGFMIGNTLNSSQPVYKYRNINSPYQGSIIGIDGSIISQASKKPTNVTQKIPNTGLYSPNTIMNRNGSIVSRPEKKSYKVISKAAKSQPKKEITRTVSRGGFGSVASAKSSWGGGKSRGWGG